MTWQHGSDPEKPAALLGVFDFSYQHYALGDLLTNQVNLAILASEQGLRHVDILVMVNPDRPSARQQTFVTRANYIAHLDNVMPVFACNPLLRSLQLVRDIQTFNFMVALRHRNHAPMWPDLSTHLKMRQDFPIDHGRINAFHARHGHIPQLSAPRGYQAWAQRFHATELEGRPLVIGGVTIPFERGPLGHSDGDVACHAATDAILGAAGLGDIGRHFPDTDPRWKDADSLTLLREAAGMVREHGYEVGNLDITVILERPKIKDVIHQMCARLADALAIEPSRVSVKGKTNEGVDAVGRGEAVASHAVALLKSNL